MKLLAVRRWSELDPAEQARIMGRHTYKIFDPGLMASIGRIFDDVARRGDEAVSDATEKFDGVRIPPSRLLVSQSEIDTAHATLDPNVLDGIRVGIESVSAFNRAQIAAAPDWRTEIRPGVEVGERSLPIASAGLFVPCGKGSFPSVLIQIGAPAAVAGVPDLIVLVPPLPGTDRVDPAVLAVAKELGLTKVLRGNGPAVVAAAAVGTESVRPVRKIVGPGSPAVTVAQILAVLRGVATNLLCGPSESLLIADSSADPVRLAADLLNEAEHGPDSAATLVTDSVALAEAVDAEAARMVEDLPEPRKSYATSSVTVMGGALLFDTMDDAIDFAGDYAPEHLQIATRDVEASLARLRYAGEILLGQDTPISVANFCLGVPATLPTGGWAKVSGGVTARTFRTDASIGKMTAEGLASLAGPTLALSDHEGFPGHSASLRIRGLG
jgi:histidinol dehydrogenase